MSQEPEFRPHKKGGAADLSSLAPPRIYPKNATGFPILIGQLCDVAKRTHTVFPAMANPQKSRSAISGKKRYVTCEQPEASPSYSILSYHIYRILSIKIVNKNRRSVAGNPFRTHSAVFFCKKSESDQGTRQIRRKWFRRREQRPRHREPPPAPA